MKPLFLQRRLAPLLGATALGAFTDNMLKQALAIALAYGIVTAPFISSDAALPVTGALFPLAILLFSSVAGQVADRYEKSMLFRRFKLVELGLMGLAAVGFLLNSGAILILALFLMGVQSAFYSPVRRASMPQYLRADELVRGNAFIDGSMFITILAGIAIGGLFVAAPNGMVIVAGALLVLSTLGWLSACLTLPAAASDPNLKYQWNGFSETASLVKRAVQAPGIIRPMLGGCWFYFVSTLVTVAVPLYVRDTLYAGPAVVTLLMALFAIGAALGCLAAAVLARAGEALHLSVIGAGLVGVFAIDIFFNRGGFAPGPELLSVAAFIEKPAAWRIMFDFVGAAAASGLFAMPLQAAVQRRAPPERRARILAAGNILVACSAIVGSLAVLSVTQTALPAYSVFAGIAIAQGLVVAYMYNRYRLLKAAGGGDAHYGFQRETEAMFEGPAPQDAASSEEKKKEVA